MALSSYLKIRGQAQGEFKGGSIQKGREGWIIVSAYNHEMLTPRDPINGLPTGRRIHTPLSILKEIDPSTPAFFNAMINDEMLTSVELKNFSPNKLGTAGGQGVETLTYSIILTNAKIMNIRSAMLNNNDPDLMRYERTEEISFSYEKIKFQWHLGNKTAEDTWL